MLTQRANNVEFVRLGDRSAKTTALLGHGLAEEEVASSMSIVGAGESGVVGVSATATSPALATVMANTYTSQFVKEQQGASHQYFQSALALANKHLAIPPQQRFSAAATALRSRAQTLRLLNELQHGNVQVAQEALPPTSPSLPKTSRNTALGAMLGLLIGLAFVLERLDRRIKGPENLEAIYRLPILGVVPESAAFARSGAQDGVAPPPAETEAFSLIRAHLRFFFNIDRDVRVMIVIASSTPGGSKSTIARHLAEAAARLGSRVLLLEADLRHPTRARSRP